MRWVILLLLIYFIFSSHSFAYTISELEINQRQLEIDADLAKEKLPNAYEKVLAITQNKKMSCSSPAWTEVMSELRLVAEKASWWDKKANEPIASSSDIRISRTYREFADFLVGNILTILIEMADAALSFPCLDIADKNYRNVLSICNGGSCSALRERAKVGIEDVRAKRNNKH